MSYCLNPHCQKPDAINHAEVCQNCQTPLLLNNRYFALKLIGQGGFGRTFLAIDRSLPDHPRCVIKQFFPQTSDIQTARALFEQEAVRLKELGRHEQIPALLDYLEQEGCQYSVQEFIDGENLAQELAHSGRFSEIQIRQLLIDLLPVLQFVHEQQVIHRDIKPQNIICRAIDRKLCLVDFGAAKLATGTALVKTGTLIGSAAYIAPEQLMGKAVFASDLYSLGVTCIQLLTELNPFECYSIAQGDWVWSDYLSSPISRSLKSILDKLLRRGTSWRYPSVAAVLQDLHSSSNTASSQIVVQPTVSVSKATVPKISTHNPAKAQPCSRKPTQGWTAKQCRVTNRFPSFCRSAAAILLLGAAGILGQIPSAYQAEVRFKAHAVLTTGVIEKTIAKTQWMSSGMGGGYTQTTYTSTIRFETSNGKAKVFSASAVCSKDCEGKSVPVLYDPVDPDKVRVGTKVYPMNVILIGLFWGLLLLWGSMKMASAASQLNFRVDRSQFTAGIIDLQGFAIK